MLVGQKLTDRFRKLYDPENNNIEEVLIALRAHGYTQVQCLLVIKQEFGLSNHDADEIVLYSKAWASHLESTIQLRDAFADALESFEEE